MKAFNGFKSEASSSKPRQLPAGAYVAKIKGVKIEGQEPDQTLILRLDVCEGEFTDFFLNRYKRDEKSSNYTPKYKGDFRLRIPNEANEKAQYPETDLKRFNDAIWRIEQSNPGFHWDWKEELLKGLLIGINVQEDSYNGYKFTKIARLEIVEDVRMGRVQKLEPKAPKGDADDSQFVAPVVDQQTGFTAVETDELPF